MWLIWRNDSPFDGFCCGKRIWKQKTRHVADIVRNRDHLSYRLALKRCTAMRSPSAIPLHFAFVYNIYWFFRGSRFRFPWISVILTKPISFALEFRLFCRFLSALSMCVCVRDDVLSAAFGESGIVSSDTKLLNGKHKRLAAVIQCEHMLKWLALLLGAHAKSIATFCFVAFMVRSFIDKMIMRRRRRRRSHFFFVIQAHGRGRGWWGVWCSLSPAVNMKIQFLFLVSARAHWTYFTLRGPIADVGRKKKPFIILCCCGFVEVEWLVGLWHDKKL